MITRSYLAEGERSIARQVFSSVRYGSSRLGYSFVFVSSVGNNIIGNVGILYSSEIFGNAFERSRELSVFPAYRECSGMNERRWCSTRWIPFSTKSICLRGNWIIRKKNRLTVAKRVTVLDSSSQMDGNLLGSVSVKYFSTYHNLKSKSAIDLYIFKM